MKLSFMVMILQLTFAGVLIAATASSQNLNTVKVDLNLKNAGIAESLLTLQRQSGIKFSFFEQLFERETKKITLNADNISVSDALKRILSNTNLRYIPFNDFVVIETKPVPPKPGRISGKIVDERGESLPGASIKVVETGAGTQASVDGSYTLSLAPGTYTLEVSYISYQTQRITGVAVTEGSSTPLDIVMKVDAKGLKEVVVTADYKKASVAGLYAQQKNAASVTDGISAEQIARTPDNNMGQVLKRVSGVTTVDNKYVVVRGMTERYNQAMIDGVVLPSTNMNKRNFSFDVLPQEMVSSVVVNKTATPDISSEFSGGQVSVNTLDIPTENFTSITIGSGYNSQSTGKDFLTLGERKGGDYLGFDNGRRKEPANLTSWRFPQGNDMPPPGEPGNDFPLRPGTDAPYSSLDAIAQSKQLNAGGLVMNSYKTIPFQNARFAIGRIYDLKNGLRAGFTGGATYRNQQSIVEYNNVRGQIGGDNYIDSAENGAGKSYRFNSTVGAVLNLGLQGEGFKLALKNMYSRIFDDNFNEAYRLPYNNVNASDPNSGKFREMFQDPQATEVWQHKLEGENLLGSTGVRIAYTGGFTRIGQQIQDQRRFRYFRTFDFAGMEYFQTPNVYDPNRLGDDYDYRMWTQVKETDYNWGLAFSRDFDLGSQVRNTAKIGYSGWRKQRTLGVNRMIPYTRQTSPLFEQPYEVVLDPANIGAEAGKAYYYADRLNGPSFDGSMETQAAYAMLDQRFFQKLRLVYGLRTEHYNLSNRQEEYIIRRFGEIDNNWELFSTTGEKNWRFLPSINLTYSLTPQMNVRAAYGKTAIRPDFRETAYFGFYDYELDANISGKQLTSTIVDNFDLRYEWYPAAGEIISVSGFYKKLKDPIELILSQPGYYRFQNQHSAKNYGLELEVRKSLGFIADQQWLHNLTLFGNGAWVKSKVEMQTQPLPGQLDQEVRRLPSQGRPLYGQAPWIVNAGLAYQDNMLGATVNYNRSGQRSNTISDNPNQVEYENGRNLLDVQVSARLWHRRAELKLNVGNLLDEYSLFYQNITAFESQGRDEANYTIYKLLNGTTAYEKDKGDRVTYRAKTGRTATLSFTYNF